MTDNPDLDPTMLEHMSLLSMTHDVMDSYREVVLDAILDTNALTAGVEEAESAEMFALGLATEITPPLLAERFLFGDNLMLDLALRLEGDVRVIWATITEDDLRKKKKRQLGKKKRRHALVYADALVDVAEALRDRISGQVCPNCGTHVIPNQPEED